MSEQSASRESVKDLYAKTEKNTELLIEIKTKLDFICSQQEKHDKRLDEHDKRIDSLEADRRGVKMLVAAVGVVVAGLQVVFKFFV